MSSTLFERQVNKATEYMVDHFSNAMIMVAEGEDLNAQLVPNVLVNLCGRVLVSYATSLNLDMDDLLKTVLAMSNALAEGCKTTYQQKSH